MKNLVSLSLFVLIALSGCSTSGGGLLDRDCTASKAVKSTAAKATVGVGTGCSPAEAAKDTAKRAVQ